MEGWWYNLKRAVDGVLLAALILGSTVGTVYNATEISSDDRAIVELKLQNRRDEDRILTLERQLTADEATHRHSEPGPVEPCMCVGQTADGKDVEIRQCQLVPECDQRAIKACEAYYPGFRCRHAH
jgi:hypothetical protein